MCQALMQERELSVQGNLNLNLLYACLGVAGTQRQAERPQSGKDSGLYPQSYGKPLRSFMQRSDKTTCVS